MAITNPVSELEDENGNILGIAAKGLDTPVQISLTGNVTGNSGNTDLSGNVSIPATIADGAVTESKIATDAVTNGKVKDGELTKAKFNANVYNEVDGTIADGTNANLATKTQVKAYVESVISSEGHYKGVQSVATINTWTAANLHNGDRVITSSDPAGSGTGTLTLGNLPVVDGQEVIFYVSDDQSVKIWQSSEGNYKIKQASKSDPTASGTTIDAIASITQNTNGEITATKKTIRSASTSQTGVVQLKGSIAANESDDSKAATPKAVRDAINALDVAEVGGTGKYIKAISEVDGKIAATEETMDTTPTEGSQKAVTSGGVKAAIDAIDPGNTGMGEVVAAALNDLDARIRANEEAVSETNLGDRTADRLDVQTLLVGGEDMAEKLDGKVDKVEGKGLSTNDFTDALKSKLDGIAAGAEVNVQSDWNQTNTGADDYIKNKPQNLVQDADYVHTDNNFTDALKTKLDGIAAGAEVNVQSDWNQTNTGADDYIKNKPQNLVQDADYVHTDNNFTDAYKGNVDANTSARHTHSNKTLLDNISQSDIDNWNSKQAALSFMTDAEVDALFTAAWNAANA